MTAHYLAMGALAEMKETPPGCKVGSEDFPCCPDRSHLVITHDDAGVWKVTSCFACVKDGPKKLFIDREALASKESVDAGDGAFPDCAPQHVELFKQPGAD